VVTCVCLSAVACPRYCTDPDVTVGTLGDAHICALLGGFTIGVQIALLWQHNVNVQNISEFMLVLALCLVYGRPM